MAPINAQAHAQREVKPSEPRLNGLIGAVRNTHASLKELEGGEWFLGCIERAMDSVSQKKEAALTMGIDAGQLKNQLKGEGHLSARRLGLLGESFFFALIDELRRFYGVNTDEERLARALAIRAEADKVITEIATKGASKR